MYYCLLYLPDLHSLVIKLSEAEQSVGFDESPIQPPQHAARLGRSNACRISCALMHRFRARARLPMGTRPQHFVRPVVELLTRQLVTALRSIPGHFGHGPRLPGRFVIHTFLLPEQPRQLRSIAARVEVLALLLHSARRTAGQRVGVSRCHGRVIRQGRHWRR